MLFRSRLASGKSYAGKVDAVRRQVPHLVGPVRIESRKESLRRLVHLHIIRNSRSKDSLMLFAWGEANFHSSGGLIVYSDCLFLPEVVLLEHGVDDDGVNQVSVWIDVCGNA